MGEKADGCTKDELAHKAVLAVKKLNQDLRIPKLKEIGAKEEDFERLAAACTENMATGDNIRKISFIKSLILFKFLLKLLYKRSFLLIWGIINSNNHYFKPAVGDCRKEGTIR